MMPTFRSLASALFLVTLFFLCGCVCQPLDPYVNSLYGDRTSTTSPGIVCNRPYIQVGGGCCLDQNGNSICDRDEAPPITQPTQTTLQHAPSTTVTSTTQQAVTSTLQPTSTTTVRCRTSSDCGVESSYKKCYQGDVAMYYETPRCSHPGEPKSECIVRSRIEVFQKCESWETCLNATCVNTTYEPVTTTLQSGSGRSCEQICIDAGYHGGFEEDDPRECFGPDFMYTIEGKDCCCSLPLKNCNDVCWAQYFDYGYESKLPDGSPAYGSDCADSEVYVTYTRKSTNLMCCCGNYSGDNPRPTTTTTLPAAKWYCCKLGGTYGCFENACPVDSQYGPWVWQGGPFPSEYTCGKQACYKYCVTDWDCEKGYKCFRWGDNSECRRVCTDSDGGINYPVKGTCTDWHTPGDFTDWCTPSLMEYYCAPSRYKWADGTTVYECNGQGSGCDCTDGSCPNWYDVSNAQYWVHYDSLVGGSPIRMRGKFGGWSFVSSSSTFGSENYAILKVTVTSGGSGSKEIPIDAHTDLNLDSFMQQFNGRAITLKFESKFAGGYVREASIYSGTVSYV